jgi:hypothetical protein
VSLLLGELDLRPDHHSDDNTRLGSDVIAGHRLARARRSLSHEPKRSLSARRDASADTYLRSGAPDTNEGGSTFLCLRASGDNRALVRFDQAALVQAVGSGMLVSASLELDITDNGDNWGSSGRTISAFRLTSDWVEGNGFVDQGSPPDRDTGSGATWVCAVDSDISDQGKDCSGPTEWEMGKPNQPELHPLGVPHPQMSQVGSRSMPSAAARLKDASNFVLSQCCETRSDVISWPQSSWRSTALGSTLMRPFMHGSQTRTTVLCRARRFLHALPESGSLRVRSTQAPTSSGVAPRRVITE